MAKLPLSHINVLDLTAHRAGPTAVRQLADWGASVVQIASRAEDYDDFPRRNSDTQNLRRNTRNITVDLRKPEGVAILKRLVATADRRQCVDIPERANGEGSLRQAEIVGRDVAIDHVAVLQLAFDFLDGADEFGILRIDKAELLD